MKDEIKEILEYFNKYVNEEYCKYTVVNKDTQFLKTLLDYITNLQEENERLRIQKDNNYELAYNYNLKIKEAIEYLTSYDSINELMKYETSKDNKGLDRKTMIEMDRRYTIIHHKLLNILQGKSDE